MNTVPTAEVIEPQSQYLVVGMPDVGLLQVTGQNIAPEQAIVELSRKESAARFAALSAMYLAVGPGEHSLRHTSIHADMRGLTASSEAIRLSSILPDDVAYYGLSGDGREVIRFGQIAIAGRKPSSDELLQHTDRVSNPPRPTSESRKNETLTLDPYKIDITGFDNVSIRIEDTFLYLKLDSPLTFLVARVLGKLSHLTNGDRRYQIDADDVAKSIWDSMPLAERAIHVKEDQLLGLGAGLGKKVDRIFDTLTSMLKVTRRRIGARQYGVQTSDISLRFGQVPQEDSLPENVSLLYPPGTNPDLALGEIPEAWLVTAQSVLPLSQRDRITQLEALDVLGVILARDGKRALNALLGGSETALAATIERLDRLARGSLQSGYYTARINRTPLSKRAAGSYLARPRSAGAASTTKWKIVPQQNKV